MQTHTPCSTPCPPQPLPGRKTPPTARLTRLAASTGRALRRAFLGGPRIRQLPIGHPDALVDRPGERRIVFGHNVLIIRDQPRAKE